jgi:signal transduction histidine kinase
VIIVTGTGSEEVAAEAIKRGAADYVIKSPKHILRLPHIIHGVLEKKRLEHERKQAEEALRESNELLSLFMKHSPIYAFIKQVTPTESRVLMASENYQDMVGIPGSKMVGMTMQELFPAEFAVKITADDWAVVEDGKVLKLDEDLNGCNFTTIKFPISLGGKNLLAGYTIDITERKQIEEKIRLLNSELEQRVEERTRELHEAQEQLILQEKLAVLGRLAGGVGHELRNPLGVISSAVYYLKLVQPDADDKVQQYLSMIETEVHNAMQIIGDLLDFARVISADRQPVSVTELIQRAVSRFPVPTSVKMTINVPANLPQIYADPRHVEQVLGNLITNARQAMKNKGKLDISAQRKKEMVAITIKDTGMGIPPENISKIFEPLFTTKLKGIGLGLAISQKLVDANGGQIEVKSDQGKGSTFTVYFPTQGG